MIIVIFGGAFLGIALLIGQQKTAKSLIALAGNCIILAAAVMVIYLGLNILITTFVACLLMALVSLFYQNDVNDKTKVAFVSVVILMTFLALISYIIIINANLQGFPKGQYTIRESNGYDPRISGNFVWLQLGVVMIMLEGAMVDTSVSVATAMNEVASHRQEISISELFSAGMNVGKGILNSTINTLFFIYMGQNLVFFIYYDNDYTIVSMLNSKVLLQELMGIVISGIGCVLIIPVTAIIGARVMARGKQVIREAGKRLIR